MKGRRIDESPTFDFHRDLEPGDYGLSEHGMWWLVAPNGDQGIIDPKWHTVTEHEDGAITVTPSLNYLRGWRPGPDSPPVNFTPGHGALRWHGWLERGVWRSA